MATVIPVDIAKFIVTGFKMIPLRQRKRKRIKGRYRRKRREEFDELLYYIRYLAETMLSFLKRKYREEIKAKRHSNQVKEVKLKLLMHNLDRYVRVTYILK